MFLEHWIQNLNKFDVYLLEKHHTLPAYISFNLYHSNPCHHLQQAV